MDAAMAATIALKEQTKNRMNFETGYLFCHVETKSSNVCSGIFCFSDLSGITSIVPRTVGADSISARGPCHYCKRPGSLASIDPCGAVGVMPYATAKCTRYKYTYPAHKNIFCNFFPTLHRPELTVFDGTTAVLLLQSARDAL